MERYFETAATVHCERDGRNNEAYEKEGIPKRIYLDSETNKMGYKVENGKFHSCDKCLGKKNVLGVLSQDDTAQLIRKHIKINYEAKP